MSDWEDEQGEDLEPADPWLIVPEEPPPADEESTRKGRRRRRRGSDAPPPPAEEWSDGAPEEAAEIEIPEWIEQPGDTAAAEAPDTTPDDPVDDDPEDQAASKVEPPSDAVEEIVEMPSWADDATTAATHIEATGLDGGSLEEVTGDSEEDSDHLAEPAPSGDTELIDLDPAAYARAQEEMFAEASPPQPEQPEHDEPGEDASDLSDGKDQDDEDWVEALAEQSPYGVATPDAFDALAESDEGDDMTDWDLFMGESAVDRSLDPAAADPAPAPPPPPSGKLSRRERRKARKAAAAAAAAGAEIAAETEALEPEVVDDVPGWVTGGPEDTAWLAEDSGEVEPADGDEALEPAGADPDDSGEVPAVDEPPATPSDAAVDADADASADVVEAPGPTTPADETVWLASDQPLVREEASETPGSPPSDETDDPASDEWLAATEDDDWASAPQGADVADGFGADPAAGDVGDSVSRDPLRGSPTMDHLGLAQAIDEFGDEDLEWQGMAAAMPGLETGVVGFDDVADLTDAGQEEYVARAPSDLGTRIATGFILVGLLLGSMWVGPEAFGAFVGLLVMVALGEFYISLRRRRYRPIALFGYLGALGTLAGVWFHGPLAIPIGLILTAVVIYFLYAFLPLGSDALTNGGLTILGVAWIAATTAFAAPLIRAEGFRALVVTVVLVTAAMDIGAYGFGRMWGSRPLAPTLSPNKTVEGLFGGIVCAIGAGVGASFLFSDVITLQAGLMMAAVVIVLAPLGDLAESLVKRSLAIKDMGSILPGHGGVLDRIDAFLFVLPGMWVLAKVLGLIA